MCTAVVSVGPGQPTLLVGVRDEFTGRAWEPPGWHWPSHPGLIAGRDLQAGGTWLAVAPRDRRVSCVLNGVGQPAPAATRRSRGELPLRGAAGLALDHDALPHLDPFRLITAEPGRASISSWDGRELSEHELAPGLHFVVNSGLASDLQAARPRDSGAAGQTTERTPDGREHELARIGHFVQRFTDTALPDPRPGQGMSEAWGAWLPLVNGDGLGTDDLRALIVRRDLGNGLVWGTTSISLVALAQDRMRYDFNGRPGDPASWHEII